MSPLKITKHSKILLGLIAIIILNSCNYIVDNKNKENKIEQLQQKEVAVNIEEAQLLVKIAEINSDIITLSSLAKYKQDSLNTIVKTLEKNHLSISKDLSNIAEKKLILIPDTTYKSEVEIFNGKNESISNTKYLEKVSYLIEDQMDILNELASETTDVDFKNLSLKTTKQLKDHLNKTETFLDRP